MDSSNWSQGNMNEMPHSDPSKPTQYSVPSGLVNPSQPQPTSAPQQSASYPAYTLTVGQVGNFAARVALRIALRMIGSFLTLFSIILMAVFGNMWGVPGVLLGVLIMVLGIALFLLGTFMPRKRSRRSA